jgi:uncharacterized protein
VSVDDLPTFRYHPDPVRTGSVEARDDSCLSCGQARGFIYVGPVYAETDLDDRLCPWCIVDGTAAERYDAEFVDVGWGVPAEVPREILDELARRTPGFTGWQQEHWLYHCGDAAAFLGLAGAQELAQHPEAIEMLRAEQREHGPSSRDADEYVAALDKEGSSTAYLFRCLHCGTYLAYSDFE